ncbi:glycerol kinase [Rhodospirillum rubrum]|uniref:glycerol kinase GlpK n=1 Tax=Rhodospirillum rubrum TaxID=1085 RepID=UPI0019082B88|nr:glycerol kinase GlpK [Rhodospirillum rubrum]MBK1664550.1 glycerol kinase [Rhodospirillum rubrum]MBK1676644.1 glycerol kinase [Rhodospirillum rubrum]
MPFLLAIDQGTTSSRAIVFDHEGQPIAQAQKDLVQYFPGDGWVEHDATAIWEDSLAVAREALDRADLAAHAISAIGLTNQRETAVLWERASGQPVHNAIVWQDRRTAALCRELKAQGHEALVRRKTGLLIDPYFSATKIGWMLDHDPLLRRRAEAGELAFGTVESWLLYKLTGGAVHASDATNAARTLLFDIRANRWDEDLLALFRIPAALLPRVVDNAGRFGETLPRLFGAPIPITGMAGDQHAAMVGQGCFTRGMIKSTYGTGAFALLNIGQTFVESRNQLLTTLAYRLNGQSTYALEGSIFVAGAAVQWLRDGLRAISSAAETQALAEAVADTGGCYMVPAFTGLGAPYWDPEARGAILGLTRDTSLEQVARAALEAQGYQTRDLLDAMAADSGTKPLALRVDGGMVANDWVCQFLADITGIAVERPRVIETTALGAAALAGLGAGVFASPTDLGGQWHRDRLFTPHMPASRRESLYAGWVQAVRRVASDLR